MFKRDLKVNYAIIEQIATTLAEYGGALVNIQEAMNEIETKVKSGKGETVKELLKMSSKIKKSITEIKEEVDDLYKLFYGYKEDMCAIISPTTFGSMMRVDRNDIYWNKQDIIAACQAVCFCPINVSTYNFDFTWNDSEEEKARKRKNAERLDDIKKLLANSITEFSEKIDKLNDYYKKIQSYENKDDEYEEKAKRIANKYTSFWEGLALLLKGMVEDQIAFLEGFLASIGDLLEGLCSLAGGLAQYVGACAVTAFGGLLPEDATNWADDYLRKTHGLFSEILNDPYLIVEAMAQEASDAIDEKGLEYGAGYLGGLAVEYFIGDKGVSKAAKGNKTVGATQKVASKLDDIKGPALSTEAAAKLTSVESLVKMGVKGADELAKKGISSIDDLVRVGINSADDLERLGLASADELKKLGITDVHKLVDKGIVSDSDLAKLGLKSGSKAGTVWDNITSTADNMPATEIPATFKIDLDGNINYVNPETGTNTLWTNSNATKHMGEYVSRFGEESWSIGTRSQAMLESYSASLNKAMETIGTETPGRYFGTYGNWELGINTETGVVYHARMIN